MLDINKLKSQFDELMLSYDATFINEWFDNNAKEERISSLMDEHGLLLDALSNNKTIYLNQEILPTINIDHNTPNEFQFTNSSNESIAA